MFNSTILNVSGVPFITGKWAKLRLVRTKSHFCVTLRPMLHGGDPSTTIYRMSTSKIFSDLNRSMANPFNQFIIASIFPAPNFHYLKSDIFRGRFSINPFAGASFGWHKMRYSVIQTDEYGAYSSAMGPMFACFVAFDLTMSIKFSY